MKQKVNFLVTAIALAGFLLVTLASCLLGNGDESNVTVNLPYVLRNARALSDEVNSRLKSEHRSYRVHMNDRVLDGTGGNFSESFPIGLKVDVYVESLNSKGEVIVRTVTKSIVVENGENRIDLDMKADGIAVTQPSSVTPPSSGPNIWMSDHEVTQKEWKDVMGNDGNAATTPQNSSTDYGKGDNYPMYYVGWYDALVYCNKLSMKEDRTPCYTIKNSTDTDTWGAVPGAKDNDWDAVTCDFNANGYRLPTEAEWEYMAKGGENHTYSGSDNIEDVAWYTTNSGSKTHEVKGKNPNKYGMYDMSGNVYEWCWDWYTSGSSRVSRGGGWRSNAASCAVSSRSYSTPDYRSSDVGFRVVRRD